MKVFVEVVAQKSQTAAAEHLNISRAMVTRYLSELEDWLGTRLMHRSTRRFGLTPAGEACLLQCQQVLEQIESLEADTRKGQTEPCGLLRIAATTWLWHTHLSEALTAYLTQFPNVKIELLLGDRRVNLVEDRIDLAIRITNDLDPTVIARKLTVCQTVISASPAYLQKNGTPLELADLAHHNCLTHISAAKSEWPFILDGEMYKVEVSGNLCTNEAAVLLGGALNGVGIAKLPLFLVEDYLNDGKLVQLLPRYKAHEMGIYGIYVSRRFISPALRTLLDFLILHFERRRPFGATKLHAHV
ncbi:LysR family transcriptional regulator [Agrobacterium tumefaciens]|uniref:LysR family transcriptional regulator n=1 Tax=Agrobacterium tumefaciens TaxID=358 RepID=UPI001B89E1BE|nr:LysR family transcriptional regulator [Agrobacterium tumefaciens]